MSHPVGSSFHDKIIFTSPRFLQPQLSSGFENQTVGRNLPVHVNQIVRFEGRFAGGVASVPGRS